MQEIIIKHSGIEMQFVLHEGRICGYDKRVVEMTKISGGGGRIYTSSFDDRVYGRIKPIKSKTERTYITGFAIAGDNDRDIHINLVNSLSSFRDGQRVTAWVDRKSGFIYKLDNHNNGEETVVTPLTSIFGRGRYYFRAYLRANPGIKWLWYFLLLASASWITFTVIDVLSGEIGLLVVVLALLLGVFPAIVVCLLGYWLIKAAMARGISRKIRSLQHG